MESDGQRLYSVLTKTELREKMMKEIVQISEIFSLSQSDATVALIRVAWNSFRASDLLGDDKEKFLSELGLAQVPGSKPDESGSDGDVSTPFCSHKFCSDCWRDYLSESLEKKDKTVMISCLNKDCVASVGPDTIEKLAEPVKEMYERYVLGSFMDSKSIKWCPASGCEYAIERHEDPSGDDDDDDDHKSNDFGVVCLCGHTFCWSCKLESHRPVTCNNASLWLNKHLDEARTLTRISKKTKPCPRCNSNVQEPRNSTLKIVTCFCSHAFCWRCLRSEEDHRGMISCSEIYVPPPSNHTALLRHLKLWKESHEAMKKSKRELEAIELNTIPILTESCGLGETDMRALREACTLIVQCRLVLKWSSVFGYFITDYHNAKKQYLDHLVEEANANLLKHKGTVDELTKEAIAGGSLTAFRHKLETSTITTGNYFHFFVKTLGDGLPDVKVDVYENVATDYWFCDRCTFQNGSFEEKCRMCVAPFEFPPQVPNVASDSFASLSLVDFDNIESGHQQQAPNVASNPFARQGGTNLFESPFGNNTETAHQQGVSNMSSSNLFAREGGRNPFETPPLMAFGNNQQQVPNMSNNPFARPGGAFYYIGASAHQQQASTMTANNPFAYPGGTFYVPMSPPPVAFGSNNIGASGNPNMASDPFASQGGPIFFQSPTPFVAFGNNNNNNSSAGGYQQQAPNMMGNNPFARQRRTNPLESRPAAFESNNGSASVRQQEAPNMSMSPLARQGGTKPWKLE